MVKLCSLPDLIGNGQIQPLYGSGTARWVQVFAPSTNSSPVRIGDSLISDSRGIPIFPGGSWLFPAMPAGDARNSVQDCLYSLKDMFCLVAQGDKLSCVYVP
jgi:hypothetical protein